MILKFNKIILLVLILAVAISFSTVNASELNNSTLTDSSQSIIYVDALGDDLNDGSIAHPVKTLNQALNKSSDGTTILIGDGIYSGENNSKIVLNKSVSIVGAKNTTFDGLGQNHILIITDNAKVTLKNINFINAYKSQTSFGVNYNQNVYGAAIEIKSAEVSIEGCRFENNIINYQNLNVFGGAISNFGNLTITDSIFKSNVARATSGLFSFGCAIYNKAILTINSTVFSDSLGDNYAYGVGIANDGDLTISASTFKNLKSSQESRGSAIYNTGNLTLADSVVEDNSIAKSNFQYIYGAVYNSGKMIAYNNIFRNNTGVYSNPSKGSPTIYNVGEIDLKYNLFINNQAYSGVYKDLYASTNTFASLNCNWWGGNPYDESAVNLDTVTSWLVLNVTPEYSMLNLNANVDIVASWSLNNGEISKAVKIPTVNITVDGENYELKDSVTYTFKDTNTKGLKYVYISLGEFSHVVEVDVGKSPTELTLSLKNNLSYLEPLKIDVDVKAGGIVDGVVILSIDSKIYTLALENGHANIEINDLNPGSYDVKVSYNGSENYFKSFANEKVNVNKKDISMSLEISEVFVEDSATATVTLNSISSQGQAAVYIDGVRSKIVYLYEGTTKIPLNNFKEGTYNITVAYMGNTYYNPLNITEVLKVKKYAPAMTLNVSDVIYGKTQEILITVTPGDLRGEAILKINGVNSTVFLENEITTVRLSNLEVGEYDIELIYEGDAKYLPFTTSASFKVYKTSSSLDVKINYDENTLKGSVAVKANALNATGSVTLYVNHKIYQMDLKNGAATFTVDYDVGTNYIYVYYEGDDFWSDASWNATIGKPGPFVLTGYNQTSWQFNDFNYTVRLMEENGMPMISREIAVEFENHSYNITTDNSGYAYLKLNLDEGTYLIRASYKNQTVTNLLNVKKITFNLTASDISFGQSEVLIAEFENDITGWFNFTINGVLSAKAEIINGSATFNADRLNVGTYELVGFYSNEHFNSTPLKTEFTVKKADSILNFTVSNVITGEDAEITVYLSNYTTGNVRITVDGKNYSKTVTNNQASLIIEKINGANHTIKITYDGDANYNRKSLDSLFYIKDLRSFLVLNVNDTVFGEKLTIKASLENTTTGEVIFKINNLTKSAYVYKGEAILDLEYLDAGNYTLQVTYLGDDYYIQTVNSTQFNVFKANSTINISCEAYLDENIEIYAYLSPMATGQVRFAMTDYYSPRNKEISDAISLWYISPLNQGSYTVKAQYLGDDNYYPSQTTYTLKVYQTKPKMAAEVNDVTVDEEVIVKVNLYAPDGTPITGSVTFKIENMNYGIDVINGEGTFALGRLSCGDYSYEITYYDETTLTEESITGEFSVLEKIPVIIEAKNITKYYKGSEKLEIYLKDSNGNALKNSDVNVKIASKNYKLKTDSTGLAQLSLDLSSGEYDAIISYAGDERYNRSSLTAHITIKLTVEGIDSQISYGSGVSYFAMFLDSNGNALANANVKFIISGKTFTVKTLANGVSRLNILLNPGNHTIKAINPKTGETAINHLFVYAKLMENKDLTQLYTAGKSYKVKVYGSDGKAAGAGKTVTFKLNGKTYKIKTDSKGYASLKINLKPGKYAVTASYGGYSVKNNFTVKTVIKAKNINVKKSSKNVKVKVTLKKVNGKYLSFKKVTLKVNGKKVTAKTNKNGVVTFTIKKNILNTLKKGKSYKYQVTYLKDSVKKTMKVR